MDSYKRLALRDAISDKEWIIAMANMETAHRDGWSCDWIECLAQIDAHIAALQAEIEAAHAS